MAVLFAKSFYTALLRDKFPIAQAFRHAREEIRRAKPYNSSWLAYVLYDPGGNDARFLEKVINLKVREKCPRFQAQISKR